MKWLVPAVLCCGGLTAIALSMRAPVASTQLVIGGDAMGYLSPCGCTKPMSGGLKRKASVVRSLLRQQNTYFIENGGLVSGTSRQDELKAETLAEVLADMGATAINLGATEWEMGSGMVSTISRLSRQKMLSTQLRDEDSLPAFQVAGKTLIGGAMAVTPSRESVRFRSLDETVHRLVLEAKSRNLTPVLMLRGTKAQAESLALSFPELRLIVYSSAGSPTKDAQKVGSTWLVSPGDQIRYVIQLTLGNNDVSDYRVVDLGPEVPTDPNAQQSFDLYLQRVAQENLLARMPRTQAKGFVGNQTCISCHADAGKVWESSAHANALATLEKIKQDRDPDCTGCHVVGLDSLDGFASRQATPQLANVGCESCHGAGADHSRFPTANPMPKVTQNSCFKCHNPSHSPKFNFEEYWDKIKH